MVLIKGCFCFESLRTGSRASAYFTLVTGLINIVINIAILRNIFYLEEFLEYNERKVWLPPGILILLFLELACNIGMVLIGLCLHVGINRKYDGENLVKLWKIGVICFRLFEGLLGIYILAWIGAYRIPDIVFMFPALIVLTFYWVINTVILFGAIICVTSYWDELKESIYGKERQIKYIKMLANIRSAAKTGRSGAATPSQYYNMSRSNLGLSQASLPSHMSQPLSQSSSVPVHHAKSQEYLQGSQHAISYQHPTYVPPNQNYYPEQQRQMYPPSYKY